ncbi:MAG: hypothetical protein Kow0037_30770 [Calditrichia bacterium]
MFNICWKCVFKVMAGITFSAAGAYLLGVDFSKTSGIKKFIRAVGNLM